MSTSTGTAQRFRPPRVDFANFKPQHFMWRLDHKVATITLNRPERKNPLTLESYAELRDTFRDLVFADGVKSVVITGAGENFCSGGDVHEIIGPLVEMQRARDMGGLLAFTRMTGEVVKAMRACPQPIVAAVQAVAQGLPRHGGHRSVAAEENGRSLWSRVPTHDERGLHRRRVDAHFGLRESRRGRTPFRLRGENRNDVEAEQAALRAAKSMKHRPLLREDVQTSGKPRKD